MKLFPRSPLTWLAIALVVSGCSQAVSQEEPQPPAVITDSTTLAQRRLVLRLTLSHPSDLLVEEGDRVEDGQVLADRVNDRERLQVQLDKVRLQIDQVSQPTVTPPPIRPVPEMAGLPPATFLAEVAEVERRRLLVEAKQAEVTQQQRLLDMLTSLPEDSVPEAVIPHEQVVLEQVQQELNQAESDHQLAIAQLQAAQAERQFTEYEHSVTLANRQIQIQQNELQRAAQVQRTQEAERDRQFQLSQLEATRDQIETQLFNLSAIRAPFGGTIQRISWEGQNDQALIVELTLVAGGSGVDERPGTGSGR